MINNKRKIIINKEKIFEPILPDDVGKVFNAPYYTEFSCCQKNRKNTTSISNCKRLDKNHYVDIETGEVKEYKHNQTKTVESFRNCHKIIPMIIKGYFRGLDNEREIILNYDSPLFDHKSLSDDFKIFLKGFNKLCSEYIYLYGKEPFSDGSWYMRCIIKVNDDSTFRFSEEQLREIWEKGKVTIKCIENIDRFSWSFDILRTEERKKKLRFYPSKFHPFGYTRGLSKTLKDIHYKELPEYTEGKKLHYRQQYSLGVVDNKGNVNSFGKLKYEQYKK